MAAKDMVLAFVDQQAHDPYLPDTPAARRALLLRLLDTCPTLAALVDQAAGCLPLVPCCTPSVDRRGCQQHGSRCEKPGKAPLVPWKRYQLGSPAPAAEVARWRRCWPTANWALAAGPASGLVLLDQDGDAAASLDLPPTVRQRTGRPGGWHYLRAHPEGVALKNTVGFRHSWDIRAQGGLLILPGSLHASGQRYELDRASLAHGFAEIPAGLLTTFAALPPRRARTGANPREANGGAALTGDALLNGILEGQRDATLWAYACKLRAADVPLPWAREVARLAAQACHRPFDEALAVEKVERAYGTYPAGREPPETSGCRGCVAREAALDQLKAENADLRVSLGEAARENAELKRQQPEQYAERLARDDALGDR
jgi:Bifunctional DNA primase/polymerase, N-terminal